MFYPNKSCSSAHVRQSIPLHMKPKCKCKNNYVNYVNYVDWWCRDVKWIQSLIVANEYEWLRDPFGWSSKWQQSDAMSHRCWGEHYSFSRLYPNVLSFDRNASETMRQMIDYHPYVIYCASIRSSRDREWNMFSIIPVQHVRGTTKL